MADRHDARVARFDEAIRVPGSLVTEVLERLTGETVIADVEHQFTASDGPQSVLDLSEGSKVMSRAVVLRGSTSARAYVLAHSTIAIARLPGGAKRQLEERREPIGRILVAHGTAVRRQTIPGPVDRPGGFERLRRRASSAFLGRRYLIVASGQPIADVCEWFLPSILDAMGAGDGAAGRSS